MKSSIIFCLLLSIFIGSSMGNTHVTLARYVPLISNVHSLYKTSSIFFISSNINQYIGKYVLLQSLSRQLSGKAIQTLVIRFERLAERIRMWQYVSRPLVVVLLAHVDEITDFIVNTREMNISFPIWLVIFADDFSEPMCEYCIKPTENIFRVRFDTEMLVACCRDSLIKEWWAIHENKTEVENFGNWTEKGLKLFTTKGLYERRHDVNGTGIRITFVQNPVLQMNDENYKIGGFFQHFFMELKRAMNFEITNMIQEDVFGIWNKANKSWSGAISQVVNGKADIGVGEFTMTKLRLDAVDFSYPLIVARTQLYIKQPDGFGIQWSAYFEAFACEVWMAIIILVIATPILLTLIRMKNGYKSLPSLLFENSIQIWGIYCQQGLCKFPSETPLRIAYFSTFVLALIISSAYSASFISFLTVSSASLPFSTVEGFVEDGSYKLLVLQKSSDYALITNSMDSLLMKMNKLLKPSYYLPSTPVEGIQQVCREKVAFYTSEAMVKSLNIQVPCNVIRIDTERIDNLAMILSRGSQYTGVMNYHIQRFRDNGMMTRMKNLYSERRNPEVIMTYDTFTIWSMAPILLILTGGIILAFIVLFCEKWWKSYKNLNEKSQRTRSKRIKMKKWFNFLEKEEWPQENLLLPLGPRTGRLNN